MSRIGKLKIQIPDSVKVEYKDPIITVKGAKETLTRTIAREVEVVLSPKEIEIKRRGNSRRARELHGLTRTLVNNMVHGVSKGFEKRLEIVGLGFKAQVQGQTLTLLLGYSNPVKLELPKGVQAKVDANTKVLLTGPDNEVLGTLAAHIRGLRPPEPYKGKGIKYHGEIIQRKAGKTGTSGA